MVGDQLEFTVLNDEGVTAPTKSDAGQEPLRGPNVYDPNNSYPMYIHPEAVVLYEAESDTLDHYWSSTSDLAVYVEYDVYPNSMYRPTFGSRHVFRNFQLTKNVNDIVHMYIFCQSAKIWTYDIHIL